MKKNIIAGLIVACAAMAMGRPLDSFLGVDFGTRVADDAVQILGLCDLPAYHNEFRNYDAYFARATHESRRIMMIGAIKTFDADGYDVDNVYREMHEARRIVRERYRHMGIVEHLPGTRTWNGVREVLLTAAQNIALGKQDLTVFTLEDVNGDCTHLITIRALFVEGEGASIVVCAEDLRLERRDGFEKIDEASRREAVIGTGLNLDDLNAL